LDSCADSEDNFYFSVIVSVETIDISLSLSCVLTVTVTRAHATATMTPAVRNSKLTIAALSMVPSPTL
jgi:hypothetical protein